MFPILLSAKKVIQNVSQRPHLTKTKETQTQKNKEL